MKAAMTRSWLPFTLSMLALSPAVSAAPARGAAGGVALVGAEVWPATGPKLERGTVLIQGEKIVQVGSDVAIPEGTRVIDVTGKIITPGFVAADTQIGLLEVEMEEDSNDAHPELDPPIRAAARAVDAFDVASTLVAVARRHGVTSVVSAPTGGLVSGQGGWFQLLSAHDAGAAEAQLDPVSMVIRLGQAGADAVGGSRVTAMLRLREYLDDVQTFRRDEGSYRRGSLYEMSAGRLDLEAGKALVTRDLKAVIEVHRASDIRAAIELVDSFRLSAVFVGVSEGWLVASELARAKIPVIVDPMQSLPVSFEARNARADNAAILARAGVTVLLTARSSHNAGNLRYAVGNAIRDGFPKDLALRSVTVDAAAAFGVEDAVGGLAKGRYADLVVWTGDPFEAEAVAEQVFVRGRAQPTESRQTRLAERYIERLGLRGAKSEPQ